MLSSLLIAFVIFSAGNFALEDAKLAFTYDILEKLADFEKEIQELKVTSARQQQEIDRLQSENKAISDTYLRSGGAVCPDNGSEPVYQDCCRRQLVAFTANSPAETTVADNATIIFKNVVLNEGYGYDATNGVFTAPMFTVHTCNKQRLKIYYAIVHNGVETAQSEQYGPFSSCGSSSCLVKMTKNGRVWIQSIWHSFFSDYKPHRAAFMGVLLH